MSRVTELLRTLHTAQLPAITLGLERVYALLDALGNPHHRLPPVVHVAGTNGKGSLVAYLTAILSEAGYRVHRYTSPYLVRFNEQIVLAGEEIDDARLEDVLVRVKAALDTHPATFFEASTVAAFLAFSETPADIVLLETGLGGRLDATNVIATPQLTAITPISHDHQEFLGHTLTDIAGEKAGIIKRGVPCIVGRQEAESMEVLMRVAAERQAPLIPVDFTAPLPAMPSLPGVHQFDNAATAIACARQLRGFSVSDEHIARGISTACWPARLQRLTDHPFTHLLPAGSELWLDGGHNPQGGKVLAEFLASFPSPLQGQGLGRGAASALAQPPLPNSPPASGEREYTVLILGMLNNKDAAGYLQMLAGIVSHVITIPIPDRPDSADAHDLANAAAVLGMTAEVAESLQNACTRITTPARVVIAGSLYLAGWVLGNQ